MPALLPDSGKVPNKPRFFFADPPAFLTGDLHVAVVVLWPAACGLEGALAVWGVALLFLFSLEVFVLGCSLDRCYSTADIIQ